MRAWIQPKELAIEHVRDRGEGMPVLGMNMRERPRDATPAQSRTHVRVIEHVKRIVIINELVMERLSEHRPRDRDQKEADAEQRPARLFDPHHRQFN